MAASTACRSMSAAMRLWYHKDISSIPSTFPILPPVVGSGMISSPTAQQLTQRDAAGKVTRYGVMGLSFYTICSSPTAAAC